MKLLKKFFFIVVLLLIVASVGTLGWLRGDTGLARLEAWINRVATRPDFLSVNVEGLDGKLPFEIIADQVTVGDRHGDWLVLSEIRLQTVLIGLLRGRIHVDHAKVGHAFWSRLPDYRRDPDRPRKKLPLWLRSIRADQITVDEARVGDGVFVTFRSERFPPLSERESGPLSVQAAGDFWFHPLRLDLDFTADTNSWDSTWVRFLPFEFAGLQFEGSARGPVEQLLLRGHGDFDDLEWTEAVSADALGLTFLFEPNPSVDDPASRALAIDAVADGFSLSGPNGSWRLPTMSSTVRTQASRGFAKVDVEEFSARAEGCRALASGTITRWREYEVDQIELPACDLSSLQELAGIDLAGSLASKASGRFTVRPFSISANVDADISDFESSVDGLAALLGGDAKLASTFKRSKEGFWQVGEARLERAASKLSASGRVAEDRSVLEIDATAEAFDVSALESWVGRELSGLVRADATVRGSMDEFRYTIDATGSDLRIANQEGFDIRGEIDGVRLDKALLGDFDIWTRSPLGEVDAKGRARWTQDQRLALEDLRIGGAEGQIEGDLSADARTRLVDGELLGKFDSIRAFGPLLGASLDGRLAIDSHFSASGDKQGVKAQVDLKGGSVTRADAATKKIKVGNLTADVRATDLLGVPNMDGSVHVTDLRFGELKTKSSDLSVHGGVKDWELKFTGEGEFREPLAVSLSAKAIETDLGTGVEVAEFEVEHGKHSASLRQTTRIVTHESGFALTDLDADVSGGRVRGHWNYDKNQDRGRGEFRIESLPLSVVDILKPGLNLEGSVGFSIGQATPASPFTAELEVSEIRMDTPGQSDVPPGRIAVALREMGDRLSLEGRVDATDKAGLQLRGELGATGRVFGVPIATSESTVDAHIFGDSELSIFSPFLRRIDSRIAGNLSTDVEIDGRLGHPEVHGHTELRNGVYDSGVTGVIYRDLSADVKASGPKIEIGPISGRDDDRGRAELSGVVDLSKGLEAAVYNATAKLVELRVANLDELKLVSHGDFSVAGVGPKLSIAGTIETVKGELQLPERLPPEIVDLDVVEINGPEGVDDEASEDKSPKSPLLAELDVDIIVPGRMFVRSTELDSEWEGKVNVSGTHIDPRLKGKMSMLRGDLRALGVRLKATKGTLIFDGKEKLDPFIDVVGEAKKHDITAYVTVRGLSSDPEFELTSSPVLPSDEILARLLFGASLSELSPIQSVQLAAAVARLSGRRSSRTNPVQWVRQTIGLDRLGIVSDGGGIEGSIISIGKYVTEGVYVSINQGLTEDSSKATVEVDVTERVKLQSEVGRDAESSLGLNWRLDY